MKRYLVFSGYDYSAGGGANDLRLATNDFNEAVDKAESISFGEWAHVYDCIKGVMCFKYEAELPVKRHIPKY